MVSTEQKVADEAAGAVKAIKEGGRKEKHVDSESI